MEKFWTDEGLTRSEEFAYSAPIILGGLAVMMLTACIIYTVTILKPWLKLARKKRRIAAVTTNNPVVPKIKVF